MRRVPVGQTIREAYVFAFTHLGGVIGLIWVSMLLLTVTGFFTVQRYYTDMGDAMVSGNMAALGPSILMMLGYLVAAMLLSAVMFVAVVQLALGARGPVAVAHFAFGTLEWRMFRAFFAFVGVMTLLIFACAMVGGVGLNTAAGHQISQTEVSGLFLLFLYGMILVAAPRFMVLLPAVAVSETGPVLRRAWAMSMGNFWRLLVILLAVFAPMVLIVIAVELLLGHGMAVPAGDQQQQLLAVIEQERQLLPVACGLQFLLSPLLVGLLAGASVSAWRALKDEAEAGITA